MIRALSFALVALLAVTPTAAESVAIGKYHTKESAEKAYTSALNSAALHFDVTKTDKAQGIIQADKRSWTHEVYGKLFVTVSKDLDGGVIIEATFRRSAITKFKPLTDWAVDFGNELKHSLPDLTFEVAKQ